MKRAKTYVYRNLQRDNWSLMVRGLVKGHVGTAVIDNAEFRVRPAGHARVLREKRKNVHAFVIGDLVWFGDGIKTWTFEAPVQISYNPYRGATFYRKDTGAPISSAARVEFCADSSVWAWGVE